MNQKIYQKGLTLPEMLVVIGIILILGVVSVPVLSRIAPHYRLTGASRELVSVLRESQSLAVTKQYNHITRFSSESQSYSIIRVVDGNEQLQETINLPRQITITNITSVNNQIIFTSSGAPQNSGTIQLSNNLGKTITIEVTPSGQIKSY